MRALSSVCLIFLAACGSQLRAPFCKQSMEIPEKFFGRYEWVLFSPSAEMSGQMAMRSFRFEIGKRRALVSDVASVGPLSGKMCEIGGHYYLESRNANGTYAVSEVIRANDPSGGNGGMLIVANLAIDLERVRDLGYPFHYLPSGMSLGPGKDPLGGLTSMLGNKFILDNSRLSPEQVLGVAKPFAWQTVFRSLPESAQFKARGVIENTGDGWRLMP